MNSSTGGNSTHTSESLKRSCERWRFATIVLGLALVVGLFVSASGPAVNDYPMTALLNRRGEIVVIQKSSGGRYYMWQAVETKEGIATLPWTTIPRLSDTVSLAEFGKLEAKARGR